jgi:hypothetical protein
MKCEINLNTIQKYCSCVTERTRVTIRKLNFWKIMHSVKKSKGFFMLNQVGPVLNHRALKGQY